MVIAFLYVRNGISCTDQNVISYEKVWSVSMFLTSDIYTVYTDEGRSAFIACTIDIYMSIFVPPVWGITSKIR